MIRRIQVLNYRCLRFVDLALDRFHVLVGPGSSGKSTLFDAVAFLGDLVREGPGRAVRLRTPDFRDLVWQRHPAGGKIGFELAVELDVPEDLRGQLPRDKRFRLFRYQVAIRGGPGGAVVASERGLLMPREEPVDCEQRTLFPDPPCPPETILVGSRPGTKSVLSKSEKGTDSYYVETDQGEKKGWVTTITLGADRSTLANLPAGQQYPVAAWVRDLLSTGIRQFCLEGPALRRPCRARPGTICLAPDGGNLPLVVDSLRARHREHFNAWLEQARAAVSDLQDIRVGRLGEDRSPYLVLDYASGLSAPSWTTSDGVLRLLALTLLTHLPDNRDIHLIESPENGIDEAGLELIRHSVSAVSQGQVLLASRSPALRAGLPPAAVLHFERDPGGATDIVRGDQHPRRGSGGLRGG